MTKTKSFLIMLLCVILVASVFPITTFATATTITNKSSYEKKFYSAIDYRDYNNISAGSYFAQSSNDVYTNETCKKTLGFWTKKAKSITKNCKTKRQKIVAVHNWVSTHLIYDYVNMNSSNTKTTRCPDNIYRHTVTIKGKKYYRAVCAGYANIFRIMVQSLGIHCISVSGYYDDNATKGKISFYGNSHQWNAVYYASKWHIVDCTYDSNNYYFSKSKHTIKKCNAYKNILPTYKRFYYKYFSTMVANTTEIKSVYLNGQSVSPVGYVTFYFRTYLNPLFKSGKYVSTLQSLFGGISDVDVPYKFDLKKSNVSGITSWDYLGVNNKTVTIKTIKTSKTSNYPATSAVSLIKMKATYYNSYFPYDFYNY